MTFCGVSIVPKGHMVDCKKAGLFSWLALTAVLGLLFLGVAVAEENRVIARVNGDVIDELDLRSRLGQVHRTMPRMAGEGGEVDISDVVRDLVDKRLMIQEAERVGLDESEDFRERLEAFANAQFVLQLRKEEVLDKATISEEDVFDYLETKHEGKSAPHEATSEAEKRRIRKKLRKEREKALSDAFVDRLRDKAQIEVDWKLVENTDVGKVSKGDERRIGQVNGVPLLLAEFVSDLQRAAPRWKKADQDELRRNVVDQLITYALVEEEAARRGYGKVSAVADRIKGQRESLLLEAFKRKLIAPLAVPTETEARQYYESHLSEFKKDDEVRLGEMSFGDEDEAERILDELKQGADFEFLATETGAGRRMNLNAGVWFKSAQLSPAARAVVAELEVGEFSRVFADGRKYKILKLKDKRGGKTARFSQVKDRAKRLAAQEKFNRILSEYMERLREVSRIDIHEKTLKQIERQFWGVQTEDS